MSFYSMDELHALGLGSFGKDVKISRKASIYNSGFISLGNHVRVDDFCVLSAGAGGIYFGDYIHIAVFGSLIGAGKIVLNDFSNLSSRVSVYSSNDDYSGTYLTNPMVPSNFTGIRHADVNIGKHAIIGSGSVVLPGVTIEEGVAIGALSLVKDHCEKFRVYAGVPAKYIGERKQNLLILEKKLRKHLLSETGTVL